MKQSLTVLQNKDCYPVLSINFNVTFPEGAIIFDSPSTLVSIFDATGEKVEFLFNLYDI